MCGGYGSHISGQDRFLRQNKVIYLFHFPVKSLFLVFFFNMERFSSLKSRI